MNNVELYCRLAYMSFESIAHADRNLIKPFENVSVGYRSRSKVSADKLFQHAPNAKKKFSSHARVMGS